MKLINRFRFGTIFLVLITFCSCGEISKTNPQDLPYFDLKGFVKQEAEKLDGAEVIFSSRVQGIENRNERVLSTSEWLETFDKFTQSDINRPSLYQSYDTQVKDNLLIHSLFNDSNEKVKEIKITYVDDKVTSATLKSSEKNLFYTTSTLAELYINNSTQKVDHFSIETTQKIWFLSPSNIKIRGVVKQ